jgi:predicted nucleic acid-binding Zn ribbon protein
MYKDMLMLENKLEQGYKLSKKEKEMLDEVEQALQDVDMDEFNSKLSVDQIRGLIREFKRARTKCGPVRLHSTLKACEKKDGLCNFDIGDERIVFSDLEVQQEECKEKMRKRKLRNFKLSMFGCVLLIVPLVCIAISTVWGWIGGAALTALFFYIIFWTLDNDEDE